MNKLCLSSVLAARLLSGIETCPAQKYFFTTFAGIGGGSSDGSGSEANFDSPRSITADKAGNLYVADAGNYTIRKINSAGVVSTVAGSPRKSGLVDGIGKAVKQLKGSHRARARGALRWRPRFLKALAISCSITSALKAAGVSYHPLRAHEGSDQRLPPR